MGCQRGGYVGEKCHCHQPRSKPDQCRFDALCARLNLVCRRASFAATQQHGECDSAERHQHGLEKEHVVAQVVEHGRELCRHRERQQQKQRRKSQTAFSESVRVGQEVGAQLPAQACVTCGAMKAFEEHRQHGQSNRQPFERAQNAQFGTHAQFLLAKEQPRLQLEEEEAGVVRQGGVLDHADGGATQNLIAPRFERVAF